jgi:DNA gyrase subunit B
LRLLLDHPLVDKWQLREEGILDAVVADLNATRRWEARREPDEEHHAWALVITPVDGQAPPARVDWELLGGSDFQSLVKLDQGLGGLRKPPHRLMDKGKVREFASLEELVGFILEEGQKNVTIQRFKGLGEMNPEQLWETTMDPETRTLLQVNVMDAAGADEIFTILMGDKVEPRREFIQNNVLELNELDI